MNAVLAPTEQLVAAAYVSSATAALSDDELRRLLESSRANNERLGITGVLLYRDGNFLQVLEGPAQAVDSLLGKIRRDARHQGVIVISRKPVEEREFGDWSMAFRNLGKGSAGEPGANAVADGDDNDEASQLAFRLLRRLNEDIR